MTGGDIAARVNGRWRRAVAQCRHRQPVPVDLTIGLISFTFDDFPRSAYRTGAAILQSHGLRVPTMRPSDWREPPGPTGELFDASDVGSLIEQGHELGCHTFRTATRGARTRRHSNAPFRTTRPRCAQVLDWHGSGLCHTQSVPLGPRRSDQWQAVSNVPPGGKLGDLQTRWIPASL